MRIKKTIKSRRVLNHTVSEKLVLGVLVIDQLKRVQRPSRTGSVSRTPTNGWLQVQK